MTPGQFFVLKLDFSKVKRSINLEQADRSLIKFLNLSIEKFYKNYAKYLGDLTDLKRNIDCDDPNISLQNCVELVEDALSKAQERGDKQLAGVRGVRIARLFASMIANSTDLLAR